MRVRIQGLGVWRGLGTECKVLWKGVPSGAFQGGL